MVVAVSVAIIHFLLERKTELRDFKKTRCKVESFPVADSSSSPPPLGAASNIPNFLASVELKGL